MSTAKLCHPTPYSACQALQTSRQVTLIWQGRCGCCRPMAGELVETLLIWLAFAIWLAYRVFELHY